MIVSDYKRIFLSYSGAILVRSRITIVPQTVELHSGSIRELVDPLQAYQDADIWMALGQVKEALNS
jgi:ABC-type multidrug transport system fused ATPase/permease subunit